MKVTERRKQRLSKLSYPLLIAKAIAMRSTCLRRRYGCVITKNNRIVATGYNGAPRGEDNCCDLGICQRPRAQRYSGYETCVAVHAEQNAMINASKEELEGAILYLFCLEWSEAKDDWVDCAEDVHPCSLCMRMIKNSGISKVITSSGGIYVIAQNS